jgi:peptide chain release factor 1
MSAPILTAAPHPAPEAPELPGMTPRSAAKGATIMTSTPERLPALLAEHAELEGRLADPAVHADQAQARRLGRRYAELTPVVATARELDAARADLATARELGAEDVSFAAEAEDLAGRVDVLEQRLRELLVPRDPNDGKDVILQIKAGEGGEESALFAGDLLRMYLRYAERQGWKTEVLDAEQSDLGGYKDATVAVRGRADTGVWRRLKYEGGVHRVQRVPVTESQGRIHTSAAGVLVLPEAEDIEVQLDPNDLRIDVYRSSGPGGQSVNTTDSAVRITHLPTGTVVSMQNEKSQLQNKEAALRVLRARLLAMAQDDADREAADARRSQVRTVDRSERVRTYNFAENRISDHRVGYKAYNLDQVLDGDLDGVIDALIRADTAALLAGEPAQPARS